MKSKFALLFAIVMVAAIPAFAGIEPIAKLPEPASLALLLSGIGGVALLRRLRK